MALNEAIPALVEQILATDPKGIILYKDNVDDDKAALYAAAVDAKIAEITYIFDYIKAYLEINGVEISMDPAAPPRPIETYVAGAGNHGGALVAGVYPVVGVVNTSIATDGKQNNDGKGLIS